MQSATALSQELPERKTERATSIEMVPKETLDFSFHLANLGQNEHQPVVSAVPALCFLGSCQTKGKSLTTNQKVRSVSLDGCSL